MGNHICITLYQILFNFFSWFQRRLKTFSKTSSLNWQLPNKYLCTNKGEYDGDLFCSPFLFFSFKSFASNMCLIAPIYYVQRLIFWVWNASNPQIIVQWYLIPEILFSKFHTFISRNDKRMDLIHNSVWSFLNIHWMSI